MIRSLGVCGHCVFATHQTDPPLQAKPAAIVETQQRSDGRGRSIQQRSVYGACAVTASYRGVTSVVIFAGRMEFDLVL